MAGSPAILRDSPTQVRFDHAAVEQARLVRQARARLLDQGVVTYEMVADGRGIEQAAARKWASRAGDRLITVTQDGQTLIPSFQLDAALLLREKVGDANERLAAFGLDGWGVWDWWSTPNSWLDGQRPVDVADRKDWAALDRAVDGLAIA